MSIGPVRVFIACVAVLAVSVSACSSSSSSKGESSAQASAEITTTWQSFFSAAGTPDQVQGITAQLSLLYQKAKPPKGLSARVDSVEQESSASCQSNQVPAPCALVTYDLVANGTALLSNSKGYATRVGGKWLVAKTTFCALLALGNKNVPPPGC